MPSIIHFCPTCRMAPTDDDSLISELAQVTFCLVNPPFESTRCYIRVIVCQSRTGIRTTSWHYFRYPRLRPSRCAPLALSHSRLPSRLPYLVLQVPHKAVDHLQHVLLRHRPPVSTMKLLYLRSYPLLALAIFHSSMTPISVRRPPASPTPMQPRWHAGSSIHKPLLPMPHVVAHMTISV